MYIENATPIPTDFQLFHTKLKILITIRWHAYYIQLTSQFWGGMPKRPGALEKSRRCIVYSITFALSSLLVISTQWNTIMD